MLPCLQQEKRIYFHANELQQLNDIIKNFSLEDAERIKFLEKTTRHDIKAVEYFLKEKVFSFIFYLEKLV